jgi:hypothetical protein
LPVGKFDNRHYSSYLSEFFEIEIEGCSFSSIFIFEDSVEMAFYLLALEKSTLETHEILKVFLLFQRKLGLCLKAVT